MDADACYRALETRDPRFDGRFFTAVSSTGVFCRPVCPARTPRRENCTFFPSAAAAAGAGYRPCLRCRPESAPGTPAWAGTHAVVARALRLIGDGALDRGGVPELAARLGVGDRHLRRLFLRHLGATPTAVASFRRVLFAKKLLDDTALPMTQVALAAGFGSLRRFNDAIQRAYGRPPSALRRARRPQAAPQSAGREPAERTVRLRLAYRPPLDWEALCGWLAARAVAGVERVADGSWSRTLRVGEATGWVCVRPAARGHALEVALRLDQPSALGVAADRVRQVFDLGADPAAIAAQLGRDPRLAWRLERSPGVRIPGALDPFELAVRAILGQQVSVAGATTLAGRLVAAFGPPLAAEQCAPGLTHRFPEPAHLAEARLEEIGLTRARAGAVRALARAVVEGRVALDGAREPEETLRALCALPGVGPWTAQYVALRAFGEPDAFPDGDLVLRKALGGAGGPLSARALAEEARAWRPWRGYAAMLLWRHPGEAASR